MGRNRKPKEIHELNGTTGKHPERKEYGSSALVSYKDVTEIKTPDCLRLTRVRKAFQEHSQKLLAVKILSPLDGPSYEMCFRVLEKWYRVDDELTQFKKNFDRSDPEQREILKSLEKEHKMLWDEFVQMSAKFGFTPADRAKLAFPEEMPTDEFTEFMKG